MDPQDVLFTVHGHALTAKTALIVLFTVAVVEAVRLLWLGAHRVNKWRRERQVKRLCREWDTANTILRESESRYMFPLDRGVISNRMDLTKACGLLELEQPGRHDLRTAGRLIHNVDGAARRRVNA